MSFVAPADAGKSSVKPSNTKKVEQLDFVIGRFFEFGQLLQRRPVTFKRSLVEQAKGSFLLCNATLTEKAVHALVEITSINSDPARYFVALLVPSFRL